MYLTSFPITMRSKMVIAGMVVIISASLLLGSVFMSQGWNSDVMEKGNNEAQWPMFQYNARHTGLSPTDTSGNNGNLLWNYSLSDAQEGLEISTPVVGPNGTIFAGVYYGQGDSNYSLIAVYPNGTLKWNVTLDGMVRHSPAFDPYGMLHVFTTNGSVYSIYPDNGTVGWRYQLPGLQLGDATLTIGYDGTIYVIGDDRNITAINLDGTLKWKYPLIDYFTIPSVDSDGTVYIGTISSDNKPMLYALHSDGTLKWNKTIVLNDSEAHTPVIDDNGYIYVPVDVEGALTYVYSFNPDGSVRWRYPSNDSLSGVYSSPCIGPNGNLYMYSVDSNSLLSISSGGNFLWNITVRDSSGGYDISIGSMVIGIDGTIYVGAIDHSQGFGNERVYLVSFSSAGQEKWRTLLGNASSVSHLAIDSSGIVYAGTSNGTLYAVGPESQVPEFHTEIFVMTFGIFFAMFFWRKRH